MEVYTDKEKAEIEVLIDRLKVKVTRMGYTYKQVGAICKAESASVYRWFNKGSLPTARHLRHIKKFLGVVL